MAEILPIAVLLITKGKISRNIVLTKKIQHQADIIVLATEKADVFRLDKNRFGRYHGPVSQAEINKLIAEYASN